jgi:integrase/recombinase XerD
MKLSKAVEGFLLYAQTYYADATTLRMSKNLRKMIEHLNDPEFESITTKDLQNYFIFLRTEYRPFRFVPNPKEGQEPKPAAPLTPAGLDNYWKAMRALWQWGDKNFRIGRPDLAIPQPKFKLEEVKAFSQDELKKLLYFAEYMNAKKGDRTYRMHRASYKRDVALIRFMLDTGMRIGEICRVQCGDLDLENGSLMVRPFGRSVKSKPRPVFLGKAAKQAVWIYLSKREYEKDDLLFDLNENGIRRILRSIGDRAGVDKVHPHRFRHTFAIEFLRNQRDPFTLMRLLGHSTLTMTNHYLDIVDADLAKSHGLASPGDRLKL